MSIYKSCRQTCPDFIVNEFVTNTFKTVPFRTGYATVRVTLKTDRLGDKTSTYCGVTTVTVVCRKGCLVDVVDVVVKSAPRNTKLREVIPVKELFKREAFFYEDVVPNLGVFQEGVPTFVAAGLAEGEEAIVLKNCGTGWVGELMEEHVSVILREFAKLHAVYYAYAQTNPQKVQEFKKQLGGGFLSTFHNGKTVKLIRENVGKILEFFDGEVAKKLEKFADELETYLGNVLNESSAVDVLVHGDPTSSFLFINEKTTEGATVSRSQITDWQLVKFGSPILDLSLFFFTNCSLDDLTKINQLLKHYHTNLGTYLDELHCDVNEIFPPKSLEEHWKKYAKYGLALSFLALKIVTLPTNKRPNANNEDLTVEEFVEGFVGPPSDEFVRRMKDVVKYCADSGLI